MNYCAAVSIENREDSMPKGFRIHHLAAGPEIHVLEEGYLRVSDLIGRAILARPVVAGEVVRFPPSLIGIVLVNLEANGTRYGTRCILQQPSP